MRVSKTLRDIGLLMCLFLLAPDSSATPPVAAAPEAPAQLFVVNTPLDYEDCNPGNGACDPGTWDVGHTVCTPAPGVCTLRAAIQEANAGVGADEIVFSFVAQPIRPQTALPYITDAMTINGIDQGHGGSVRLDGALAPVGTNGLYLVASNSTIRGMTITGFKGDGTLNGCGIAVDGDNNVVEGNFLGTNAAGLSGLGNGNSGIIIVEGADGNRIGGTTPAQRNVISGNNGHGIQIGNAVNNIGASGNRIIGNYIGIAPNGQTMLGNGYTGVAVFYPTSTNNQIGGTATGERNIIAGNGQHGVALDQGTSGNLVVGNYIGTNISGTQELPNARVGVLIHQSSNNTVGGTTAAARNIIAASGLSGVEISVPPAMTTAAPSVSPVSYGLRREGEPSAPISEPAALVAPADGNIIQGNYIGLDVSGTQAFSNNGNGVLIHNASSNQVGGAAEGAGNVIAGNLGNGILIQTAGEYTATGNLVQGNRIGVDATGLTILSNGANGVAIYNASYNTIGGTPTGARNVIAGNMGNGVEIRAGGGGAAEGNLVQGNLIGLNASGMALAPNTYSGVMIYDASRNTVGGAETGAGNVIAGNGQNGVTIQIVDGTALSNTVQGNLIGAYQNGSFSDPDEVPGSGDDPGNRFMGIGIEGASGNQIGGATSAARNIVVGSAYGGIYVFRPGATGNQIQGNLIGVLADQTPAGNGGAGIWISEGTRNLIGGTGAATNTIAFNADVGVLIADNAISNTLQGNAIYLNDGRPVDLDDDGFTSNDLGDVDTGANQRQNFPTILGVKDKVVTGTLASAPNTTYRVELFAYEICNAARGFPVGYGDGERYLTFKNVTTDAQGNAAFTVTLASALPVSYTVAATATDPAGNTSELSNSPYKLRVSSSTFIPKAAFNPYAGGVPDMHVLLYGALDELQAAALKTCGLKNVDMYVVVNGDAANPRKMTNDGAGRLDRTQADFNANDVHPSLWFTPTEALTYTLELYVVQAGKPFVEALLSDRVTLTPNPQPELVALTDLRELYKEFNLTSANSAIQDRNTNHTLDYYEAVERIRIYAAAHKGVVLDVRQDAYVEDFDYANAAQRAQMPLTIDWLAARLPAARLKSIAIIGDDAVVPFYRFPDPKADDESRYEQGNDAAGNPLHHGVATIIDTQENVIMTDVPYSNRAMTTPPGPDVDWGLGRIFALAPLSLVAMIDGYEKPAVVGPLTGSAFTFNIRNELYADGTVKFGWQANTRTLVNLLRDSGYNVLTDDLTDRGTPRHRLWWDETAGDKWVPGNVTYALNNPASGPRLTILNSHATHYYNTTPITLHFTSGYLNILAVFPGSVFVNVGCHAGYTTGYDATNDPQKWNYYTNALVRGALERQITYHASTTFGKTTAGAEMRFNDRVHYQFLRGLFGNATTMGEVHRRAIRTYYTYHPRAHFEARDIIGVYGTELYGLPTQPIQRQPGAVAVQQLAAASTAPTAPQATGTLTASFDVPVFRITAEGDATRFEVPHDGEMTAVGTGPLAPVLARSFYFPAGTTGLTVTLVASDTALHPVVVQLPLQQAGDRTWGVETVPFTGTALYPAEFFWTAIYSDARGVQLALSAIPLRYDPLTGQVTLYHHLEFQVDYDLPDNGTLAPTTAPDITALSINGGAPVGVDQASLPLSLTATVAEDGPLTLRWVIEDAAGQPVRGDIDVVTLTAGVNVLAWDTDSLGWQPGPKVLHAQLADAEDVVLATAQTPFTAQGRSLAVTTDQPLYGPDATQVIARAEVRDTTGALVPGLSGALAASLDGVAQALVWQGDGVYTTTLDVAALAAISHTLDVTLPGGPADTAPFSVDRIAPTASLSSPEVAYAPAGIPVTINGDDDLSGVAVYRLQYRIGETGAWTDWLTRETTWNYDLGAPADLTPVFGPTIPAVLQGDATYYFRVQAVDWAGNVETLHADADTWTTYVQLKYVYLPLVLRAYDGSGGVLGNIRYVKRYAADSGDCLTPATACGTIQYAVDVALDGDTIAIAGYADAYTLENPGGDPRNTYWQTSTRPKPDGYYGPDEVTQVVLVDKSLTLRGGYSEDFKTRNPVIYKTVLRPGLTGGAGRGVLIAPFVAVTLEDLYILEGDATGLGGAYHSAYGYYDAGGGVHALGVSYRQDALIIRNCVIAGNRASDWNFAEGGGIYIKNRSSAQLIGNVISSNFAGGGGGQGGGLFMRGGAGVRLETNSIISNTGTEYGDFQGGGACLYGLVSPVIRGNTIAANVGTEKGARVLGGGLYIDTVTGAVISGNIIRDNVAGGYEVGAGGGLSMYQSQNITLRGNSILGNIAAYAGATGTASSGGGLRVSAGCANIVLENNIIARNQAPYAGSGLLFTPTSSENLVVTLRHNTIADNRLSESANQRISESANGEWQMANGASVDQRLSELADNALLFTPYSLLPTPYSLLPTPYSPLLAVPKESQGIMTVYNVTLNAVNTIIAGHTRGIFELFPGEGTLQVNYTLWYANTVNADPTVARTNDRFGSPDFVNAAAGDYHIGANSAARDAGPEVGVTTDIDGDVRDDLPDIGADEYMQP